MDYIVLDMEWNQPAHPKRAIKEPVVLHGEIVQIGAVKLDEDFRTVDTFEIMVRPKYYKKMHKFVSEITGITNKDLENGIPFPKAVEAFKAWCGSEFEILIWGYDDISMLRDNLTLHGLDTKWLPKDYNLQLIFDKQITRENRQMSLASAMERVGETPLDAHDALNDAKNTACICTHLDMKKGIAEYSSCKTGELMSDSFILKKKCQKAYSVKEAVTADNGLSYFNCPICGEKVICADFVRQSFEKYLCITKCKCNKDFFVKLKFTRYSDISYRVIRSVFDLDEDKKKLYFDKKEQNKQRRCSQKREQIKSEVLV